MVTIVGTAEDKEMGANVEELSNSFAGDQPVFNRDGAVHLDTAHEAAEQGHAATDK